MAESSVPVVSQPGSAYNVATEKQDLGNGLVDVQRMVLQPGVDPVGLKSFQYLAVGGGDAVIIKSAPGQFYGYRIKNNSDKAGAPGVGYTVYVRLHDGAGTPVPGVGVKETIPVGAGETDKDIIPHGVAYQNGLGMTIVQGIDPSNNTPVAANDCLVVLYYA